MQHDQVAVPPLGRMMFFADGENLVLRIQAMLNAGRTPRSEVIHVPDTFVWQPSSVWPGHNQVLRCTYYTYVTGDENRVRAVTDQIKSLSYQNYNEPTVRAGLLNTVSPGVFRKLRGKPAKGVDIQMTVDALSNVYMNNLDASYLISGDGDYRPVIEEAIRHGKQVFLAALSSGLSQELKNSADWFLDLDGFYFNPDEV